MEKAAEQAREGNLQFFLGLPDQELRRLSGKVDDDGRTLLHSACSSGSLQLVQHLVDHGSSVATADEEVGAAGGAGAGPSAGGRRPTPPRRR